jgi:hypothetical protein
MPKIQKLRLAGVSFKCNYIKSVYNELLNESNEVGTTNYMILNPQKI